MLVAEDDEGLRSVLERGLKENGYAVDTACDGEQALRYLDTYDYEVAILDWRMPKVTGLEVIQRLRRRGSALPVLMLTARDTATDRVTGLDQGADDYLVKPFDFDELFARLQAVLRRKGAFQGSRVAFGNLRFDALSRELVIDDKAVTLSAREIELIDLLLRRAGRVVSRQLVEDQLFGMSEALNSNAVEVYIHRLRRKLEQAGADAAIETVRGVGYLLRLAA